MKISVTHFFLYLIPLTILLMFGCSREELTDITDSSADVEEEPIAPVLSHTTLVEGQYIVVLKPEAVAQSLAESRAIIQANPSQGPVNREMLKAQTARMKQLCEGILKENRLAAGEIQEVFAGSVNGMLMKLDEKEYAQLSNDERVDFIEQDRMYALSEITPKIKTPFNPSSSSSSSNDTYFEITPVGVWRVGGSTNVTTNSSLNANRAWIFDTGINNHSELNIEAHYNLTKNPSAKDKYGHGTHVAGIIGAKQNNTGIRGIAAGVSLINVKVINDKGEGFYSDLIAGLNMAALSINAGDVVNLSLGGDGSAAVDLAITDLANLGVKIVASAGNDGQSVSLYSPSRIEHPNVYVVGAIDWKDDYASFSNYGSTVDFAAPGVAVYSTFGTDQYAFLSGTSMATPHVTGVLLASGGTFLTDGSSSPDPEGNTRPIISY